MSQPVIEVQNLSKRYHLGAIGATSLREEFIRIWDRVRGIPHPDVDEFWALRDVSFDIHPGEVVGVIGRNGAGKSTLLKILSRITEPTSGTATLRGRVASLLEVGTGFHPELTGRENVFLNGAILGMTRAEVQRKFAEIVAFAEVEKFIDTPVKRYSSGMYVRLAFAVAAHLEPEILIVDEVLAVGDLAFQRRCMEHMSKLSQRDSTILLVSHNMSAVKSICQRCLLFDKGRVEFAGETDEAIARYADDSADLDPWALRAAGSDATLWPVRLASIKTLNSAGAPCAVFHMGERLRIRLEYQATQPLKNPNFCLSFRRSDGVTTSSFSSYTSGCGWTILSTGQGIVELLTPPTRLVADSYQVYANVWDHKFQNLACGHVGPSFHIVDEVMNSHFGVSHELGEWSLSPT